MSPILCGPLTLTALESSAVERRYILFAIISFTILLGSQALQVYLFPRPPAVQEAAGLQDFAQESDALPSNGKKAADASNEASATEAAVAALPVESVESVDDVPRVRHVLGSLDPDSPAQMLVTFTSRGAAVERIELAGGRFHDQDTRTGHLGHLACEQVAEGCRIGLVGSGTPADRAGLKQGDIIAQCNGVATPSPTALSAVLAATKPGQRVDVEVMRDGLTTRREATLGWRPLEVVRPEFRTEPLDDGEIGLDGHPCDPLSFQLSLESCNGKKRSSPSAEIPGHELNNRNWVVERADEKGVRFTVQLPGGLSLAKEYRLVAGVQPDGPAKKAGLGSEGDRAGAAGDRAQGNRLELTVELRSADKESSVVYSLDGPTGLPTEGWWYTARVARDWGSLAVRDMAMRFVGEQSTLVSSLKITDGAIDYPATAVRAGKPLSFAGVDALYFAAALIPVIEGPNAPALSEVRPLIVGDIPEAAKRKLVNVTCRLVSKDLTLNRGEPISHRYEIFAGPKKPELLSQFGAKGSTMDDLVYYGWFGWVARPMIAILHAIHLVVGNYGLAILLLTIAVRGAMFPVSRKQALSSQKMQVLQPEMKAIADKYKNEPEKRTKATQELWSKHSYNPMGGCLLVFIQVPIFMGLYRSLATDVELRQAPLFSSAIRWCSNLAAPDMLYDWSKVLPPFLTAPDGWLGPYLNLFPLATIGLFLWQQKLFMPPAVDEQSKMQQQVMKYMMFFMALMFFKVPCGLCLYFIASSLWGIAERLLLPTSLPAGAGGSPLAAALPAGSRNGEKVADAVRQKRLARKKR